MHEVYAPIAGRLAIGEYFREYRSVLLLIVYIDLSKQGGGVLEEILFLVLLKKNLKDGEAITPRRWFFTFHSRLLSGSSKNTYNG